MRRRGRAGLLATGRGAMGTHCVFCMLFSVPFHPLPELSVHGLQGNGHSHQRLPAAPAYPAPWRKLGLLVGRPATRPLRQAAPGQTGACRVPVSRPPALKGF